ncbi:MAG: FAD:protein FMN transferase [Paucibacter sp.]|nr:FAD:protein FMN transferase [Roseateles sp.]
MLGTLVSIEVDSDAPRAQTALDEAFDRVAAFHKAMSFHEPQSDLRRLARTTGGETVSVAPETHAVLALAQQLERESAGAFNVCCASTLVARGLLPHPPEALAEGARSLTQAVALLDAPLVHIRATPWIDLGGIAKGFAVDAAVRSLQDAGLTSGLVNAGGDLRVFGSRALTVRVRDPREPAFSRPLAELSNMACATTAWALAKPEGDAEHLVRQGTELAENAPMSVTVCAPSCAAADALTKVVWLLGVESLPMLRRRDAEAFVWYRGGASERL